MKSLHIGMERRRKEKRDEDRGSWK